MEYKIKHIYKDAECIVGYLRFRDYKHGNIVIRKVTSDYNTQEIHVFINELDIIKIPISHIYTNEVFSHYVLLSHSEHNNIVFFTLIPVESWEELW